MNTPSKPGQDLRTIELSVKRFDPSTDHAPYYATFTVPVVTPKISLLACLRKIEAEGHQLAFRSSCRAGRCGVCAVRLDGQAVLACRALLAQGGQYCVDPLFDHGVIRDLVVSRGEHDRALTRAGVFPVPTEKITSMPRVVPLEESARFRHLSQCIGCLVCSASCPVFARQSRDFAGPTTFVQMARWSAHPTLGCGPYSARRQGLDECLECACCSGSCPQGIDVLQEAIRYLKDWDEC